ncbi:CPBP family intramembrane glutamic endopeptidase [Ectobacillus ponti]|uniref:CPBP family intramembrane metalloprotease n=1 Tax=Ectobacillus ponti TaxID=2961894 RepID=A0AA41X9W1_9BACI|nr:CPBP family intramembrane glutamic endopeptidase [Ectobacillus ponti]MCP8968963.1 CPBP family intramembrane metalloprotease [Ectobacillus ponti]
MIKANNEVQVNAEFSLKQITPIMSVFSLILAVLIFVFIQIGLIPMQAYFSFNDPSILVVSTIAASIGFIILSSLLAMLMPANLIDDTNKTFQNETLVTIVIGMLVIVLFEELLYRGMIQNGIFLVFKNEWAAIAATTLLFVFAHKRYFKKPFMLLNIAFPGLLLCWIYFYTDNIIVPFTIHYIMNTATTLLFKYNVIRLRGNDY